MPTTNSTSAEILQALNTAECIASNLTCGAFDIARQEIAREDLAGARRPLIALVNDEKQPPELRRTVKNLLIHLGTVFARIGDGQRDKAASRAPAIRDYCRAIRDYLGADVDAKPATVPSKRVSGYKAAALAAELGLNTTGTVNKYAKLAGITTPRRGERNYTYPTADVKTLCRYLSTEGSDSTTRNEANRLLQTLPEIAR